jgi:hypothetical protein
VLAGDPQALLRVDGPGVRPLTGPQKDILELIHAGVREEQGPIPVRYEGRTGDNLVTLRLKELQKVLADLFGGAGRVGGRLEVRIHRVVGHSVLAEWKSRTEFGVNDACPSTSSDCRS